MAVIDSITLRVISAPLKQAFETALETIVEREAIIVEVKDSDGISGWGEVVAFSSPWYTEETIHTCLYVMQQFLIPAIIRAQVSHPDELQKVFEIVRGHHMAKSGIECAYWDLYCKQKDKPLFQHFGGKRTEVEAGVVVAANDLNKALNQIEKFSKDGYKRYKVKVKPDTAVEYLSEIRKHYPNLPLMADANSCFDRENILDIKQMDSLDLLMIEQPFGFDDLLDHSSLQRQITTPVCLDESITSFTTVQNALELESCRIISVKMGRVGGWTEAKKIHDYCLKRNIGLWCGGMIEFGISRAHNIALATLEGFTIPGDISSSDRFWNEDIITPEIVVRDGKVKVSLEPGIGYDINKTVLERLKVHQEIFTFR